MEPLLAKLAKMHDLDRETIPLIDGIIMLATHLGTNLEPYAPVLLQRAISLCANCLSCVAAGTAAGATNAMQETADSACQAVTFALDLMSSLCESLKQSMQALLATLRATEVVDIAVVCASGKSPFMRQSAFALIGDLAAYSCSFLQPRASDILALCSEQLAREHITEVRTFTASVWATSSASFS